MRIKVADQGLSIGKRLLLTLALSAMATATSPTAVAGGLAPAYDCNPLAVDTCGLPFPSDVFRSVTGTYSFKNRILDKRVSGAVRQFLPMRLQFPAGFRPDEIFNQSSGFSALGPVLFELNDWPFADIPADGEGYMHVYSMKTGERVPMVVKISEAAKGEDGIREGRPVIVGWPETRFNFGERYLAVLLKDGFNEAEGSGQELFTPTDAVTNALTKKAGLVLNWAYEKPLATIAELGIAHEDILSFTWFTVRKEAEVVGPMTKMISLAADVAGQMTDIEVAPEPLGDKNFGLVTLTGDMRVLNFRQNDGGVYPPYEPVEDFSRRKIQFNLSLPKWDQESPIPVSIWAHGLGSGKDFKTTKGYYELGDRLGMATIGIDHPNHGTRVSTYDVSKEPYVGIAISNPRTILQLLGMFVQTVVDQNVLARGVKNNLPTALNNWQDPDYPNVPQLDTSRLVYDGISLGAMVGSAVGATVKDISGVYLVNGAGSLAQSMVESTFWPMTSNVIPQNINGAEMMFVLAMMQHYLDIADGNNFTQFYRAPMEEQSERALAMHYALGDGSFPNTASLATAQLTDLPAVKILEEPIENIRFGDVGLDTFENGFGLVQSGYGLEYAEVATDALIELDIKKTQELMGFGDVDNKYGVDFEKLGLNGSFYSQIDALLGKTNNSLDDYLSLVQSGEVTDFLTHFNRGGENARHRQIDWRCDLLNLDPGRCQAAKDHVTKDVERIARGELINEDQLSDIQDPTKGVGGMFGNLNVSEGSAGSLGWLSIGLLALLGFRRRESLSEGK